MKTYKITIQPAQPDTIEAIKTVLIKILASINTEKINKLIRFGGVVREGYSEKTAKNYAKQLRNAGAVVEVQEMETTGELFRVRLVSAGTNKIQVVKAIKNLTGLGLKESKNLVDELGVVGDELTAKTAYRYKNILEVAGATVNLEYLKPKDPEPTDSEDDGQYVTFGKVKLANGEPAGGLLVRAYDRDLRSRELLGEVTTKKDGSYQIKYSSEAFKKAEKGRADLMVEVFNEVGIPLQAEFSREGIIFNAKQEEKINLTIQKTETVKPSEYERLIVMLNPLLDGATLSSLSDDEMDFLIHESEIEEFKKEFPAGAQSIFFLVQSVKLSEETNIPSEAFYSWQRKKIGLISKDDPKDLELGIKRLLENNNKTLLEILISSIKDNVVPKSLEDQLEYIENLLDRLRSEQASEERQDWQSFEISGKVINATDESAVIGYSVKGTDINADPTFKDLGKRLTNGQGEFYFELKVPENQAKEPRKIEWVITSPQDEEIHREITEVVPTSEESFTLVVKIPKPKLPGEDTAINDLPVELSNELKEILKENDISNLAVLMQKGGFAQLANLPKELQNSQQVKELQGYAHLSLLSPDLEPKAKIKQSQTLMTKGYFGPRDIADASFKDFQTNLEEEIAIDHLNQLYNVGKAQSFLLDNYAVDRMTNFFPNSETDDTEEDYEQQDPRLSCSCEDCQSAVSPGAYLTDLIGYVTKHIRNSDTDEKIDLDFLVETFHHPLKTLPINCAATKNKVRQVRIAIEVLYKSLESQVNNLADNDGVQDYVQSSYESLLQENGTSIRDLQRARSEEEKEKIAERIGIAVQHVDELYLQKSPQNTSNLLSENNLERIFGLPAFLKIDDGSVSLYNPLRFLKNETDKPLLYEWRLAYLKDIWQDLDFPEDAYSEGNLPLIDPDLIGPDDFRNPSITDKSFSLWVKRREWLDDKISQLWSLVDTLAQEDSFDKLLNEIQKAFSYTSEAGQSLTQKPWAEATDRKFLLNKRKEFAKGKDTDATKAWLEKRKLTYEAFMALAKIASELPNEESEQIEIWHTTIDVLAQSLKKAFMPIWVQEETDEGIQLDSKIFWKSLTEPKEGNWSAQLENNRPLIDPETLEQRDLPDGVIGQNARGLWQQRQDELSDKKKELLNPLQTDEDDRLTTALQLALDNPPTVPNAEPSWISAIEELNKQRQSLDGTEREEAERIIKENLFLSKEAFDRLVQLKDQFTDPNVEISSDDIEKTATDLTSAFKIKSFYPTWSQEEDNQDLVYWKVYKAKLPKWRGNFEARFAWKYALDMRSKAPIIDPDIVPGEAIVEPVPGEKTFDLWRERTKELIEKLQDLQRFDISTRDGVSNIFNEVLGITLDEVLKLGETEGEGQPIDTRLDQLTLNREGYWLLLEVAKRTEEGKTVLDDTWKNIRAILLQIWKKRQFTEWQSEEKGSISLSPEFFTLPSSGRFRIKESDPELNWRRDNRRQREWQSTFRSRRDQQNSLSSSLKEVISSVEEQTLPKLRDNLIEVADTSSASITEKANRLTDRFLIDMQNSGCRTTTRVGMALEVLQTLVFSVQSGQLELGDLTLELQAPNFNQDWRWVGSYATWKAAMGVFLYPEQILIPSLKRDKSPAFNNLIDEISNAGEFNSVDACRSASKYYEYLDDIRNLVVDATCYATTTKRESTGCGSRVIGRSDRLHLFGVGKNTKQIYSSDFDIEINEQSHWTAVPKSQNVKTIVGAALYDKKLMLVAIVAEEDEENKLCLFLNNLETGVWEDPQIMEITDKTLLLSAVLVEQIDDSTLPMIALKLKPLDGPNYFPSPYLTIKRINKTSINWEEEGEVGIWDTASADKSFVFFDVIKSAIETRDGYFIFGNGKESKGYIYYFKKDVQLSKRITSIPFKQLTSKIIGAFRYPDSNEVCCITKNGGIMRPLLGERYIEVVSPAYYRPEDSGYYFEKHVIIELEWTGSIYIDRGGFSQFAVHSGGYQSTNLIRTISKNRTSAYPSNKEESNGSFIINLENQKEVAEDLDVQRYIINSGSAVPVTPFIGDQFKHKGIPVFNSVFDLSTDLHSYSRFELRISSKFFLKENISDRLSSYISEAYYFIPLAISLGLSKSGNFEDALNWYKRIYDFSGLPIDRSEFDRHGLKYDSNVIYSGLVKDEMDSAYERDQSWLSDPINPHSIASIRPDAYKKFTIFSVLGCLLDYGEAEFTLDSVESVARARVLFDAAASLLDDPALKSTKPPCQKLVGKLSFDAEDPTLNPLWEAVIDTLEKEKRVDDLRDRIAEIRDTIEGNGNEETKLLNALRLARGEDDPIQSFRIIPNIQVILERNRSLYFNASVLETVGKVKYKRFSATETSANDEEVAVEDLEPLYGGVDIEFSPGVQYAFCVPENPTARFLKLRTELNLFKIRNCMNIAGMRRELEPYAAPTDVESAMPSIGAGGQVSLPGTSQIRPTQYRYNVLVDRARQMTGLAQQTESAFLSALQSKDREAYTLFTAKQNIQTSKAGVKLQNLRLNEAEDGVGLAELQRERAEITQETYQNWISAGLLASEQMLLKAYRQAAQAERGAIEARTFASMARATVEAAKAGVSAGAAAFALAGYGMAAFVEKGANLGVVEANLKVQKASFNSSYERREKEWKLQEALAQRDIDISAQQINLAEDRVDIVEQEQEIAELQTEQAEDKVHFLQNKFTSAELYDWMSSVLERIFRYYLQQGSSMAKLAETQLAFERQEALLGVIQNDYYELVSKAGSGVGSNEDSSTDRRGLTGSARLLQDITKLDQYAFTTDERKQQLGITFSLARLDPFAFQQFRQNGVLTFDTPQESFDRRFPGQYLRLIKRVRTSVIALVPPTQGISATLSSSGISRVVTGGNTYQTQIIRRDPETIAFTAPVGATGVFELNPNPGMLLPFEGNGVDTRWEFRMPKASNPFDFNSIADVLITIEYTAIHDFTYQQKMQRELDPYISADRAFSFRQQFADAWYDLNNPDQTNTPMSVGFATDRGDFPTNVKDVSIAQILLYFVSDEELPEELTAELTFTQDRVALGGEAKPIEGVVSTRHGNGSSWLPIVGKSPQGDWQLSLTNSPRIQNLFKDEKIKDILFVITYSGQNPEWPE